MVRYFVPAGTELAVLFDVVFGELLVLVEPVVVVAVVLVLAAGETLGESVTVVFVVASEALLVFFVTVSFADVW